MQHMQVSIRSSVWLLALLAAGVGACSGGGDKGPPTGSPTPGAAAVVLPLPAMKDPAPIALGLGVDAAGFTVVGAGTNPDLTPPSTGLRRSLPGLQGVPGAVAYIWRGDSQPTLLQPAGGCEVAAAIATDSTGSTVVGYDTTFTTNFATCGALWTWTEGSGKTYLELPAGYTIATLAGASADVSVLVGYLAADQHSPLKAFRWSAATGFVVLDIPAGAVETEALAVSRNGDWVVGQALYANGPQAVRWSPDGAVTPLGYADPTVASSTARTVSNDGTVVGAESATPKGGIGGNYIKPARWVEGGQMEWLVDDPVAEGLDLLAAAPDGSFFVGGSANAWSEAWIWDAENGLRFITELMYDAGLPITVDGYAPTAIYSVADDGVLVGEGAGQVEVSGQLLQQSRALWLHLPNLP